MIFYAFNIKSHLTYYFPYTTVHFKEDQNGLIKKVIKAVKSFFKDLYYIFFDLNHIHEKTKAIRLNELKDSLKITSLVEILQTIETSTEDTKNSVETFFKDAFLDFQERMEKILEALSFKKEDKSAVAIKVNEYLEKELAQYTYSKSKGFVKTGN
jgi:hypothetical protein